MAAVNPFIFRDDRRGFNTQPPEGGCKLSQNIVNEVIDSFNTQPPEGGCVAYDDDGNEIDGFNTQPPEGGCE